MENFPQRFGKYILLDRIASGGMAEVFRAKVTGAQDFQRLVAIKCILPHLAEDAEFSAMFVDEAKMASTLSHANISQIYELGNHAGRLYIVMELIDGCNLRELLRRSAELGLRIPDSVVAYIISKAAEGLDYAHRVSQLDGTPIHLVHRDVSPQNILVSFDGAVKVVDFGIAKAEQRITETQAGVLKGKFSYMSPEQIRGKGADARSDIFALGAVLWELLAGEKLFSGASDLEVLEKVRGAKVRPIKKVAPHVSHVFQRVLDTALAATPGRRFQRAHDLAEALQPLMIDKKVIVGSKVAAQFMAHLFESEIANLLERYQIYRDVRVEDFETETRPDPVEHTQVFSSFFDEAHEIEVHEDLGERKPFAGFPGPVRAAKPADTDLSRSNLKVGQSQIRIEPTDSGSVSLSDLKSVGGGPQGLLRALIALIVVLVLSIIVVHGIPGVPPFTNNADDSETTLEELGFLQVSAEGAQRVEVFVNGQSLGLSPAKARKVHVGTVHLKLVEQLETGPGRVVAFDVLVAPTHTEEKPLRLTIPME